MAQEIFSSRLSAVRKDGVKRTVLYYGLMEPRGIYRERRGWGDQGSVHVKYDEHQELDVPEDRYRARDYQPPFDQLPWKDESANDNG